MRFARASAIFKPRLSAALFFPEDGSSDMIMDPVGSATVNRCIFGRGDMMPLGGTDWSRTERLNALEHELALATKQIVDPWDDALAATSLATPEAEALDDGGLAEHDAAMSAAGANLKDPNCDDTADHTCEILARYGVGSLVRSPSLSRGRRSAPAAAQKSLARRPR